MRVPLPQVSADAARLPGLQGPGVRAAPFQQGEMQQAGAQTLRAGLHIMQTDARLENERDDAATRGGVTALSERYRKILDAPEGYRNQVGKAAVDGYKAVEEQLRVAEEEVAKGLANDVQREQFAQIAARQRIAAMEAADQHYSRQSKAYNAGETKALIDARVQDYVTYDEQGPAAELFKAHALQQADALSEQMGYGPAQRDALRLETTTAMHGGRIDRLLAENRAADARAYLDAKKGEMAADAVTKASAVVERATTGLRAQNLAGQIERRVMEQAQARGGLNTGEGAPPSPLDPLHRIAEGRELIEELVSNSSISPAEAKAADDALQASIMRRAQADAQAGRQSLDTAAAMLRQNPSTGVSALPPALQEDLRTRGLLGAVQQLADNGGVFRTEDPTIVGAALTLPDETMRKLPADVLYTSLRGRLSDQDLRVVMARHAVANGAEDPKQRRVLTLNDKLERTAVTLGILNPTKDLSDFSRRKEREKYDLFRAEFDAELRTFAEVNKREATDAEVDKLLDLKVNDKVKRNVGWWDGDVETPLRNVPAGKAGDAFVQTRTGKVYTRDIAPDVQADIARRIRDEGGNPTFQEIAETWAEMGRPKTMRRQ